MEINRDNYEAYLLDLMEGRLNDEETRHLREFIRLNPDCAADLSAGDCWELDATLVHFPGKESLHRELPGPASKLEQSDFGLFCIARMEGDLHPGQVNEHEQLIRTDPDRNREWQEWNKTRLVAVAQSYPGKKGLKKHAPSRRRVVLISILSAAAALALVFALFRTEPFNRSTSPVKDPVAAQSLTSEVAPEQPAPVLAAEAPSEPAPEIAAQPVPESVPEQPPLRTEVAQAATLSFRKHEDPPELTGKGPEPPPEPVNSQMISPAPFRIAASEQWPCPVPVIGQYDRISPLEIPAHDFSSDRLSWTSLNEKGLKQSYRDFIRTKDISLLTVASSGIDGLNRLTGSELSLNLSRDDAGEVSGFRFQSGLVSVTAPVRKTE
jgi:hypothetical protein